MDNADKVNREAEIKSATFAPPPTPEETERTQQNVEDKIEKFIKSRKGGDVKLNDFLKSLYTIPRNNEPAEYTRQGESKFIRKVLSDMIASGKIVLADEKYLDLGKGYYKGEQQVLAHYDITNVEIIAKN